MGDRLEVLLGRRTLTAEDLALAEEVLLEGDLGPELAGRMLEEAGRTGAEGRSWREVLGRIIAGSFPPVPPEEAPRTRVTMLVGINGSGKTTTAARLAWRLDRKGAKVLLACADTFRAAAAEQISEWGRRLGVEVHRGAPGSDPGSVAFDAVRRGSREGFDEVLVDTAGRVTGRSDLMAELGKIHRVCGKALEGAPHETLLVMDASTGRASLPQARAFRESLPLTGLVLTKMDGTARGGSIVAVAAGLGLPVKLAGVGEGPGDLADFDPEAFAEALLGGCP